MKKASDLANNALTTKKSQDGSKTTSENSTSAEIIEQLFARFQARYGQKWTSRFTSQAMYQLAKQEWRNCLARFTDREIIVAFEASADEFTDWPPNAVEFKQCCKAQRQEPEYKPLTIDNPTKPETVKKAIAEMKKHLEQL